MDFKEMRAWFLGPIDRQWVQVGPYKAYMRKSHRYIEGRLTPCIDVANVINHNPGKGHFAEFLAGVEKVAALRPMSPDVMFVESVLNDRLGEYLLRHGFTPVPLSLPPSFYRRLGEELTIA